MPVRWDEAQGPHLSALKQRLGLSQGPGVFMRWGWGCGEPGSCWGAAWDARQSSRQYSVVTQRGWCGFLLH